MQRLQKEYSLLKHILKQKALLTAKVILTDVTPCDYFLSGYLKDKVYRTHHRT